MTRSEPLPPSTNVDAVASEDDVVSCTATDVVIAVAAVEPVVAEGAGKSVIVALAEELVVADAAADMVLPGTTVETVVASTTGEIVLTGIAARRRRRRSLGSGLLHEFVWICIHRHDLVSDLTREGDVPLLSLVVGFSSWIYGEPRGDDGSTHGS